MKSPGDGYFWAFSAGVPACIWPVGAYNPRRHSTKRSPLRQERVRAPPTHLGSPIAHLYVVATLLDTLVQALQQTSHHVQKKMHLRHFSPHFFTMSVADVCTGIGKVTMKGVFQVAKEVHIHRA